MGCSHDSVPSGAGPAVALPCRMVRGVEGVGTCLLGAFSGETWGIDARSHDERCNSFSSMDCDL